MSEQQYEGLITIALALCVFSVVLTLMFIEELKKRK